MKNPDKTKHAFDAVANAITKSLGRGATRDQLTEVVLMLAHSCLTENQNLDLATASHNVNIFCDKLKVLTAETQKNKVTASCGRLM